MKAGPFSTDIALSLAGGDYGCDFLKCRWIERELQDSDKRYRLLFDLSPDAVIVHFKGKVVMANAAAARLLSVSSPEELLGLRVQSLLHQDYRKIVKERMRQNLIKGKVTPLLELKIVRPDGSEVCVEATASPFPFEGKRAVQVILRDITERRRLEDEYLKISKLESLGVLAGSIAHEFNNILTVILGNLSMAKMYHRHDNRAMSRFKEIEEAALQAVRLSRRMLTFARGGEPVKKTVDITGILSRACEVVARSSESCHIYIEVNQNAWSVEADEEQLLLALECLLLNAVQAMPGGGMINIKAGLVQLSEADCLPLAGQYVKIAVSDQGGGICPEHILKIFDPFYTTKPEGAGLGLGLTTAYSIVKRHGGYLTVESEPGRGSTFYVYLPASLPRKCAGLSNAKVKEGKVLVMDDEPGVRKIVGEMLSCLGYEADFAACGEEVLDMYQQAKESGFPFDAVILDLTIQNGLSSKETIARLLDMDPEAKVLVSSGYASDQVLTSFEPYGFRGIVTKPYGLDELDKAIKQVLKK